MKFNEMVVVKYKRYLNFKLLNLIRNSSIKTRLGIILFLIYSTIFIFYLFNEQFTTNLVVSCIFKNHVLNIALDHVLWV